ncbi:YraN family protein [Leptolyngbya sp. 'hensonii']|uniref:YraN family protein n=1 Tax=Leptolyngbya sp. 'hensonii' TaxID=1922337 RepID=UPI0009501F2E|nr:YraN family protein [Leptolyngbya sp. 'hensonii']OLP16224.1 YraN family protein [Leptolyngbya sp. 'hensonii']
MSSTNPALSRRDSDIGALGEDLVSRWLQQQGWMVLYRRWHCRWGEIDLIARWDPTGQSPGQPVLAFLEVKTRSYRNWDADGLLSITPKKQQKLWLSARSFLGDHPDLAELPCRFDVALVCCRRVPVRHIQPLPIVQEQERPDPMKSVIQLGQPVVAGSYQLVLQDYISGAFDR